MQETACIIKTLKRRFDFLVFVENNISSTELNERLVDIITRDITIGIDDKEYENFKLTSDLLYQFFIQDYKEISDFITIDYHSLTYFYPPGVDCRSIYLLIDFENIDTVRRMKLKYPSVMEKLPL